MTYFLLTGDEGADLGKLRSLLDGKKVPSPTDPRQQIRIEAENFKTLDNYVVEPSNDRRVSHRLSVRPAKAGTGAIRTPFAQPYTANNSLYDAEVRYLDEKAGRSELRLYVNGVQKGRSWTASADTDSWQSKTIPSVIINTGDEIMVQVRADGTETGKLDYVQLIARAQTTSLRQGRIAYSCDGNNRDRDDLFASAVTIAIFGAFGATDKVVHFDYNSILGEDDPEYLKIHEESVRGAAKRFGLSDDVIFNDSTELDAAIDNIRNAVNASSPTNPLYFVIAGPMEANPGRHPPTPIAGRVKRFQT
jgi:hypothetical protein